MPTKLYEKPPFQRHIRDRLKRYDRRLDLLWNGEKGRWEIWQGVFGKARVEIRTGTSESDSFAFPRFGFATENVPIKTIKVVPAPKPFRVMTLGDILVEDEIFGRLWLGDVWRFKNADQFERDIVDTNQKQSSMEERRVESEFGNTARDTAGFATGRPLSGYGGRNLTRNLTEHVRKT